MDQSDASHPARRDLHVRHLTGHPDNKRKICEIKVVWRPITGENETAGMLLHARLVAVAVIRVRITQTVHRIKQCPRKDHGAEREQQMNGEMAATLTFVCLNEKSNRKQCGARGDHDKNENQKPAEILLLGYLPYFALRCGQDYHPVKGKDNDSDCVPTCNCRTPGPKISPRGNENRHTGGQSQDEAMPCVLPRNKIDNAHVSGWLS